MQRCPKCNRTYQDDSQKFCTFDGGRLMVDAEAPTTFDLGPAPQTDPLGATVMGPAPDMNKTVAGTPPPLTSEIPPPAQTGPTHPSPQTWQGAPQSSMPPPQPPAQTGPTTTSPLAPQPAGASQQPTAPVSGGLAQSGHTTGPQTGPVAGAPPTAAPQSGALGAQVPPRPKSNKMLFLVGGLAVLFLFVIAGGAGYYFMFMKPQSTASNSNSGSSSPSLERDAGAMNSNSSANANSGNANAASISSQPPVTPPPNSTRFVSSREKVTGSLAEHFVDFSLYYPNNWIVDPKAGTAGSSNFFRASRYFQDDPASYVLEIMSVGWYQSNGTMQLDRPIFPNRVEYFNNLLPKDFPEYQKISEGETSVNGLEAYQFTFKSTVTGTEKGDINLWGRVIFLPVGSESAKNGVVLLMVASSDLPEIKSVADVGEKGELPTILKTFRFGS